MDRIAQISRSGRRCVGSVPVACTGCGVTLLRFPSQVKRAAAHYCSLACRSEHWKGTGNPHWKGGRAVCFCGSCGATFAVWPASVANGEGRYCSAACRVGGITKWVDAAAAKSVFRRRAECRALAGHRDLNHHTEEDWRALLAAHGNACAHCGGGGRLERAHVVHLRNRGDDSIGNIRPLCVPCTRAEANRKYARA